ncbi:hypothetical protein C8J57DRAFT_1238714 [Mycena rebaudengoi]|nr:hypothetical protein C8J57DRAFT_1238714 [Mycena rebaudengoi]
MFGFRENACKRVARRVRGPDGQMTPGDAETVSKYDGNVSPSAADARRPRWKNRVNSSVAPFGEISFGLAQFISGSFLLFLLLTYAGPMGELLFSEELLNLSYNKIRDVVKLGKSVPHVEPHPYYRGRRGSVAQRTNNGYESMHMAHDF